MSFSYKIIATILLLLVKFSIHANNNPLNLEKISDDLKFSNAAQFINLNRHNKAIEELSEYLEIFINGIHRHEAYKHIAQIYFQRFDYQKAIRVYRRLYEEFGNSEDGVEAYYMIGICFKKMGFNEKAAGIFREIINNHPDSNFAYQSQLQIDLLKILNDNSKF